jgi:hypothetical protein
VRSAFFLFLFLALRHLTVPLKPVHLCSIQWQQLRGVVNGVPVLCSSSATGIHAWWI